MTVTGKKISNTVKVLNFGQTVPATMVVTTKG